MKPTGTVKQYDWNRLTKDLMDSMFYSQQELSVLCQVSQQSISNWKNHRRNVGIFARKRLYAIAMKKKIDLSKYEIIEENIRLLELFSKMSEQNKMKVLQYCGKLVK